MSSIKSFISKETLNPEIIDEIERIEEEERKDDRSKMVYEGSNETCDFRKFKTIRVFGNEIRNNIINMSMSNDKQNHLSRHIRQFKSNTRPQSFKSKKLKGYVLNSVMALLKGKEMVFKEFDSEVFLKPEELKQSEKSSDLDNSLFTLKKGTGLKRLTPKKMLQKLPIALAQIKTVINSKSTLNEIR